MHLEKDHEERAIASLQELGYIYTKGKDIFRQSSSEVLMIDVLRHALERLNPHLPTEHIASEILNINDNVKFFDMLKNGIPIEYQYQGEIRYDRAKIIDWENPNNNTFHVVNQLTITGSHNQKRPDVILYINGFPMVVFELKSPSKNDTTLITQAFEQLEDYKKSIPQLFLYNAFCVIDDGAQARVGTTTSAFSRFVPWSSLDGSKQTRSTVDTIINGMCFKERILDLTRNFIFYVQDGKKQFKIIAGWHQYFAIKKAIPATEKALNGNKKIGVLWHTQGSGKSFTMVMYSALLARDLKNPTILILTDRNDLDDQLYKTFGDSRDHLTNTIIQASDSANLREILSSTQSGQIIFTTLHKFIGEDRGLIECLSTREDIIVIADEAHRSHYGAGTQVKVSDEGELGQTYSFSKQVRTALPNASFIGFTGTPIEELDKSTREVFGDNIHVYGLAQSVKDGMTVGISYFNKAAKLHLNENILKEIDTVYEDALENGAPIENIEKSKKQFTKSRILYEHTERLELIAEDLVQHFENRPQKELKGMIVTSSRESASSLYDSILSIKPEWNNNIQAIMTSTDKDSEELKRFKTTKHQREVLATNFKDPNHEFNLAIVVDMWLTGFDVPCLGVMYLDKDLEKHNLMQTIARVNRVYPAKNNGLIYDYRGIFTKLQEALRIYSNDDREYFEDYETVLARLHTLLAQISDFFFGIIDIKDFLDINKQSSTFSKTLDYLEGLVLQQDDKYQIYRQLSSKLNGCFKICYNHVDNDTEIIIAFLLAINRQLNKLQNQGEYSTISLNKTVEKLVLNAINSSDLEDVLLLTQQNSMGIEMLNEDLLAKISRMSQKNIAIKTIEKLLNDKISVIRKTNLTQSKKFSEMLKSILLQYENKSLTNIEVLQSMLELAHDISSDILNSQRMNLSQEEYAFYCAINGKDIEHLEQFGPEVLRQLCSELVHIVKSSKTIDWSKKESAQAKMRITIRKLLKKYKYPDEGILDTTTKIIEQAEAQEIT